MPGRSVATVLARRRPDGRLQSEGQAFTTVLGSNPNSVMCYTATSPHCSVTRCPRRSRGLMMPPSQCCYEELRGRPGAREPLGHCSPAQCRLHPAPQTSEPAVTRLVLEFRS